MKSLSQWQPGKLFAPIGCETTCTAAATNLWRGKNSENFPALETNINYSPELSNKEILLLIFSGPARSGCWGEASNNILSSVISAQRSDQLLKESSNERDLTMTTISTQVGVDMRPLIQVLINIKFGYLQFRTDWGGGSSEFSYSSVNYVGLDLIEIKNITQQACFNTNVTHN